MNGIDSSALSALLRTRKAGLESVSDELIARRATRRLPLNFSGRVSRGYVNRQMNSPTDPVRSPAMFVAVLDVLGVSIVEAFEALGLGQDRVTKIDARRT